jgi:2-methylisocitrate lyase-like PEP mutase family enzyme
MASSNTFRSFHNDAALLILPNAWDSGSARLIESLGARAIATTSAALAWSRGYPDGDALPIKKLLDTARDIARIIRVPLTVDIEGGYSSDPKAVAEVVARIIDVGAVGINLEDGASPTELLCAKIEAARKTAARVGVDLFINARTDVYLRAVATGDAAVEEVSRRAELYRAAGCDGIFVPCLVDGRAIEAIATAIDPLPLNIMLMPGLASVSELRRLGVRRLSAGAAIAQAALSLTSRLATDFLGGSWDSMFSMAADYNATNQLFRSIEEQPAEVQTRST